MGQRFWTEEEKSQLKEEWGEHSQPALAKKFGRSLNAIKIKAQKLGLGAHLNAGVRITFSDFLKAIGQSHNYSYLKLRLVRDGFPVKKQKVNKEYFLTVDIDKAWNWMELHKDAIDFSRFEENALGKEPEWVRDKRKADCLSARSFKKDPWSKNDDEKLLYMLNQYRHSYFDISQELRRTEGAIKRRLCTLELKQRPIRKVNKLWEQGEVDLLAELKEKGYSFEYIGQQLGRTGSACRGRYERLQHPEYFKRENRRKREHFKQFFQKEQCSHWNRRNGCAKNGKGCDECVEFVRRT